MPSSASTANAKKAIVVERAGSTVSSPSAVANARRKGAPKQQACWRLKAATPAPEPGAAAEQERPERAGPEPDALERTPASRPGVDVSRPPDLERCGSDECRSSPKADTDLEGQMSAREGCNESVATSSTCMPTTTDMGGDDCVPPYAGDVRHDAGSDAVEDEPPLSADLPVDLSPASGPVLGEAGAALRHDPGACGSSASRCRTAARASLRRRPLFGGVRLAYLRARCPGEESGGLAAAGVEHVVAEGELPDAAASDDADAFPAGQGPAAPAAPLLPPGCFPLQVQLVPAAVVFFGQHTWASPPTPPSLLADQEMLRALAASAEVTEQLTAAARQVRDAFGVHGLLKQQAVLYGSLALVRPEAVTAGLVDASGLLHPSAAAATPHDAGKANPRPGEMTTRASYVTNRSDVDFAMLLPEGRSALGIIDEVLKSDPVEGWRHEQATVVPRFAVSQWTLINENGVHLDLTCFTDELQFVRFRERQNAFRSVFWRTRQYMGSAYGVMGILAFDTYVYVLKAFAAFVSRSAFTSFQAVCLGLFVLQHAHCHRMAIFPSAHWLFNNFLCFCTAFFSKGFQRKGQRCRYWHGNAALDLSSGQTLRRVSQRSRAELYFVEAEERCGAPVAEWQNVLHNSDPVSICSAAETALEEWFLGRGPWQGGWARLGRDLAPCMKPRPR